MGEERTTDPKPRVLVVDDDEKFASTLALLLRKDFEVDAVHDGNAALARTEAREYDAYLLDVDLQSEPDGLEVLRSIRGADPDVPAIMVSRHDRPDTVLAAGRLGATDFFGKGDVVELLAHRIQSALARIAVERKSEALERLAAQGVGGFVGESEVAQRLRRDVETVATTGSTVLITGESGTGKGVLARLLHARSRLADGPFVEINCAAVPESLVESELFGHERGSFTGATAARRGCFELANDGTLFLDEVMEMPIELQGKLLRILQSGEYSRLGSERTRRSSARIICATNKDPGAAVKARTFREDLYYRVNVVPLEIEPLRARPVDIPLLARHFVQLKATEQGKPVPMLNKAAIALLSGYDWPGNVRELENAMERAVVFCRSAEIGPELLGAIGEGAGYVMLGWEEARRLALRRFARSYLTLVLRIHQGSVTAAAKAMGISRQALYKNLEEAGVEPESFRA